jgi:site-specific recombinase XerD
LRWDDIELAIGRLHVLANDGQDTRAIQHYLGHRSIASTVRYTALAPDRFKRLTATGFATQ